MLCPLKSCGYACECEVCCLLFVFCMLISGGLSLCNKVFIQDTLVFSSGKMSLLATQLSGLAHALKCYYCYSKYSGSLSNFSESPFN